MSRSRTQCSATSEALTCNPKQHPLSVPHRAVVIDLTTDACLTADPGVATLIPAQSHTFVEIDHKIMSKVILLLLLIQKGLSSVTSEVCAQSTG